MWNKPTSGDLENLPRFYSTEDVPFEEKIVEMHFFLGGCDWYAVEYSPEESVFFGYAILNNDFQNAEWGYFSFAELCELKIGRGFEVDRDLHWAPTRAREVDRINRRY